MLVRAWLERPLPFLLYKLNLKIAYVLKSDDVTSNRTDGIRWVVEAGSVVEWVRPDPLYLQ